MLGSVYVCSLTSLSFGVASSNRISRILVFPLQTRDTNKHARLQVQKRLEERTFYHTPINEKVSFVKAWDCRMQKRVKHRQLATNVVNWHKCAVILIQFFAERIQLLVSVKFNSKKSRCCCTLFTRKIRFHEVHASNIILYYTTHRENKCNKISFNKIEFWTW